MLKRADDDGKLVSETRTAIETIRKYCFVCTEQREAPRRFELTIGSEDLRLIFVVPVDIMLINGKPTLHMVDEVNHFSPASFLRYKSEEEIWRNICRICSMTSVGPPYYLVVDQGSSYVPDEMGQKM